MRRVPPSVAMLACCALLCTFGAAASGDNLVPDGTFDSGVSSWTASGEVVEIDYAAGIGSTLAGGSGPGSMKLTHSYWDSGTYGAYLDIQVTGGAVYNVGASYYVPSTDNPADKILVQIYWYDSEDKGFPQDWIYSPFDFDEWTRKEKNLAAPETAVRARFYLRVGNPVDENETRPSIGYFDDVVFQAVTTADASQALFVPAGAAVHGQAGTYWSTNFWLANLTDTTVWVDGAFLRQGQEHIPVQAEHFCTIRPSDQVSGKSRRITIASSRPSLAG